MCDRLVSVHSKIGPPCGRFGVVLVRVSQPDREGVEGGFHVVLSIVQGMRAVWLVAGRRMLNVARCKHSLLNRVAPQQLNIVHSGQP